MNLLIVFAIAFYSSSLALASDGNETFSVKAEVNKSVFTIGEKVEYQITITHNSSVEILSKAVPPPSDVFEVKEAHDLYEKQGKQIVEGRRFILTTYELGEFILEPVKIKYRLPNKEEKTAETNRIYLTVRSVDASGKPKTDIRGPKGVLELKRHWLWLWMSLITLLAGGLGFIFWRHWKSRLAAGVTEAEPALSPEDEALLRLNRLFDSDLLRQGKMKEYFLELSEILRHYFERRFDILAVESTTSEIAANLRQMDLSQSLLSKILEVLDSADLVKFAKWHPAPTEITHINQLAKSVVEEGRPQVPLIAEEQK